jgi:3-hydroxyacyl-[acyl-carrier-protein] dehydratase
MLQIKAFPKPEDILPHDKPMSLVNKIEKFEFGKYLEATTSFELSSFFFQGHFAYNPVTPGIILVETMFQTCGLYLRLSAEYSKEFQVIQGRAIKIKEASFLKEVKPNEEMTIVVNYKHRIMNFFSFECYIKVNEKIVCKSELVLS